MDCKRIRSLAWDFAAGTLSVPEREKVMEHLSRCADCDGLAAYYSAITGQIRSQRSLPANPYTCSKVMQQLKKPVTTGAPDRLLLRHLLPLAAVIIIGLFSGILLVKHSAVLSTSGSSNDLSSWQQAGYYSVGEIDSTFYSAYVQSTQKTIK